MVEYFDNCEATNEKIARAKELIADFVANNKYSIKDIVAEIYNIYQDYLISEEQEIELYNLADPDKKYNNPSKYWYDGYGCHELYEIF